MTNVSKDAFQLSDVKEKPKLFVKHIKITNQKIIKHSQEASEQVNWGAESWSWPWSLGKKFLLKVRVFETKNDLAQTWAKLAILSSLLSRVHALAISLIYFSFCKCPKWTATICQTKAARDVFGIENACIQLLNFTQVSSLNGCLSQRETNKIIK